MHLNDFDFDLPERLIATRPARPRTSARLLLAEGDQITDRHVFDLPQIFRSGDLLVLNDTKVIPARLSGLRKRISQHGSGEARIEATLLEPQSGGDVWSALIKPLRKVNEGEVIRFSDVLSATLLSKKDGEALLRFNLTGDDFDAALNEAGAMPLPPYIAARRAADAQDNSDYQTVFAENSGAVAAPTASLHFDKALLAELGARGVE
ncbi:MAG: S-adenosylmethionine:tRNA ribosyltransferase-isomerase, partial [Pseudomonadota bacterium]